MSPNEKMLSLISKCKADILTSIAGHEQEAPAINAISKLTQIENNLRFITGSAAMVNSVHEEFPPITDFMGEKIERAPAIVAEDLKPLPTEKELFLAKVAALQSTIRDRQPETLISDFSTRDEELVLRKVAINAGLEDAREAVINIEFIERVKAGLDAIDTRAMEEDLINLELNGHRITVKKTEKVIDDSEDPDQVYYGKDDVDNTDVDENNPIMPEDGDEEPEVLIPPVRTSRKK